MNKPRGYRPPTALASSAEYDTAVAGSGELLVVVDVHGWGGPCTAVDPLFRRLAVDTVRPAPRRGGAPSPSPSPSPSLVATARRAPPPRAAPPRAQERLESRLALYTVDESLLAAEQRKVLPAGHPASKPLFLVFKQRVLVAKVCGALAPELEAAVVENLPPAPAS